MKPNSYTVYAMVRVRRVCLALVAALFMCAALHAANEPDACDDPATANTCDCSTYATANPCKCSGSGTSAGCIKFGIDIPGIIAGDSYNAAVLMFQHEEPSITMHTAQGLDYISPATSFISNTSGDFTESEVVSIGVTNSRGTGIGFSVADGSSVGAAEDSTYIDDYELVMLDASELPIIDQAPTYIKFIDLADNSYVLFDFATGDALRQVDEIGRVYDFSAIEVIRSHNVIRQIKSPSGLVDFVVIDADYEFEIRFYRIADVDVIDAAGLYTLQSGATAWQTYNIQNPAYDDQDIDQTFITRNWDGRVTQWQFQYYAANDLWEMKQGEIINETFELHRIEESSLVESGSGAIRTDRKIARDAAGNLLSESVKVYEDLIGAENSLTSVTEDPSGANLITLNDYYLSGTNAGEHKVKTRPDGSWIAYEYDSENRAILTIESLDDLAYNDAVSVATLAVSAKATYTSYTSVDANDDGSLQPDQPRTETVKVEGVVTGITYNAYYRDANGLYHEIAERVTSQSAGYGDSANLRSEKIYYATFEGGESTLRAGRLKSEQAEDGSLTTYDYAEAVNGDFTVTQTSVHADAPSGVANHSTRTVKTYDDVANLVREELFVFDGADYQSVYYLTHTYDDERNKIETRRFDGIAGGRVIYSASYDHGKATFVTDESGRSVSTLYDILDRKVVSTIAGSTAAGVGAITESYGYSTAATGCGCSAAETLITDASGTLTMTEINETDRVKRATRTVDVNGLETTYAYTDGGRTITVTNPDGSTRITTNYLDGRVKSITGTGVIPEYYTYGVNTDGSTWTQVNTASASSPRYRKTTFDNAGRLLQEEAPAYDGSTLVTGYTYDSFSRLSSQTRLGQADTLYQYDSLGQLFRSGLDVNDNGLLDLSSADRITDTDRSFLSAGGAWFDVSSTTVYPTLNSAAAVTVSTSKRRLSGFSGTLASESASIDTLGNTTMNYTEIDRANQTVTRTTDTPSSTIDAVSLTINGYLKEQNSSTVANSVTYGYDDLGRRTSIKDPRHAQATSIDYYTGTRQVFTQTDGAGNTTSYAYHANGQIGAGQVASVTNALLQKSYQAYDLLGRQVQAWGETDYPQAYSYNIYGELETLTTWRDSAGSIDFSTGTWPSTTGGDVTTWTYQPSTGLLTRKEYADTNGTDYTYDSANRLDVRTWARDGGLDTTYSYDPATGELLNVNYEAIDTADITYTYDRLGRQATVVDATGTRSFAYDSSSLQLDAETLDASFYQGHILDRSNDTFGRSSGYALKDSGGTTSVSSATYTYDTTGRFETVTDGIDTFTYGYETDSNLLASVTAPQHSVAYTYEPNRNVMTIIDNQVSGSSLSKYTYTYDALGRRADREQSGSAFAQTNTDTFAYNHRSEVTGSTNDIHTAAEYAPSYTYDQIGNRVTATGGALSSASATYTSNNVNQYSDVQVSGLSSQPSFDWDGNLTSNGGLWTYTWNNENRLKNATNGTVTIDFVYDYQGRLVKKDDGTNIEVYVYDGWNRIAKHTVNSSFVILNSSFTLWGLDLSGSLQGSGGVGGLLKEGALCPTFDANGNVMQKLDGVGATAMNVDYDPFGNIISGTLVGEYGFSTKPLIDNLDWYYYGFRYYDATTGRWPNRDPIEEEGGLNLYGFVYNNPVYFFDVLGGKPSNSISAGVDASLGLGLQVGGSLNFDIKQSLCPSGSSETHSYEGSVTLSVFAGVGIGIKGKVKIAGKKLGVDLSLSGPRLTGERKTFVTKDCCGEISGGNSGEIIAIDWKFNPSIGGSIGVVGFGASFDGSVKGGINYEIVVSTTGVDGRVFGKGSASAKYDLSGNLGKAKFTRSDSLQDDNVEKDFFSKSYSW